MKKTQIKLKISRKEKRPDPGERGAASLIVKNVNQAKNRKDKRADPGKRGASQSESGQEKQTTQKRPTRNTVNVGRKGQHQKAGSK